MPIRVCLEPRCGSPAVVRGRCRRHPTHKGNQWRSPNNTFYASKAWARDRRRYLFEHPICERCDHALAEHVHHVIPIEDGGPKRPGPNGLQALCSPCHTSLHRTMVS